MMICAKCQHELKPDAAFCARCGTPVGDDNTVILPKGSAQSSAGETVILPSASAVPKPPESTANASMQARLPGFSMALDVDRPTEILQPPAPAGLSRKLVFGLLAGAGLIVLVVVWSLISGGDDALKAGPQLAEPDVVASEPAPLVVQSEPTLFESEPAQAVAASEPGGLVDVLPPTLIEEAASVAPAQAPKPAVVPARPRAPAPPKASDEDEAYLRQIRRQLEQQKDW